MSMKTPITAAALRFAPLVLLLAMPPSTQAQSAEEILMTALDRYEDRMAGIQSYTVVQETMGFETSITFVRADVDGRVVFLPEGEDAAGAGAMADFYRAYPKIAERAEVQGRQSIQDEECWIVGIDDLSGLDLGNEVAMGEKGRFIPRTGKLYVDTDDYLVRRMDMEGEITSEGETTPMSTQIVLSDYRDVKGMLHPFAMHITASGISSGMSQEDMEEARRSLAEMEKSLEGMSESQRQMVMRMMGPQMEQLKKMLETGQFQLTVTTKDVQVTE